MEKFFAEDYAVNTHGEIISYKRGSPRALKPRRIFRGDYLVVRTVINGQRILQKIHRLVAEAFIPNPDNKPQVNHKNGNKQDNRVENLEWVTHKENARHAADMGLYESCEDRYNAKFTNEQVVYIRNNPDNFPVKKLAEMFNVPSGRISEIQTGKTYKTAGGKTRNSQIRLTEEEKTKIRRLYVKGSREFGCHALAKLFGITPSAVWYIVQ